jgi:hypothetical protein
MGLDATSLPAIAHELDLLTSELRSLESKLGLEGTTSPRWDTAAVTAQADALHIRLDALADEVHGWQAQVAAAVSRVGDTITLGAVG